MRILRLVHRGVAALRPRPPEEIDADPPAAAQDVPEPNATEPSPIGQDDSEATPEPPAEERAAPGEALPAEPAPRGKVFGRIIKIPAPITDTVERHVRRAVVKVMEEAQRRGQPPVLVFEIHSGSSEFGEALDIARLLTSDQVAGATTVAYLPETVQGHGVLVALACDEIMMSPDAEIGNAGADEPNITAELRSVYTEIAQRRKTVPLDLALGMLDPELEVLEVETEVSREFVVASRLDEVKQQRAIVSTKVIKPAGQIGVFSGREGRELGFVSYLADNTQAVARALGLSREAIEGDPSLDADWQPVRIDVRGPISKSMARQIQRMIADQIDKRHANLICLWIDSAGGSPIDSLNLANYLAGLDPDLLRTVAYIPAAARGDAAFIALACDQIVMHPDAILGGSGSYQPSAAEVPELGRSIAAIAEQKMRPPSLAAAMIDPAITVNRYVRESDPTAAYLTPEELAQQPQPEEWKEERMITSPGQVLQVSGEEAEQLGLARWAVTNFDEFKQHYGLENDPALVAPRWTDSLIEVLNSPGVSMIILLIGIAALYAELHTPGVGVAGLIAALCFMLYFWANFLGGTADWLEILMFVAGLICLALEFFLLPGMAIFGITGVLLVLGSLLLASQTFVLPQNDYQLSQLRNSLLSLGGVALGAIGAIVLMNRFLFNTPLVSAVVLTGPTPDERRALDEREALAHYDHLVGSRGTTLTRLSPAGKVQIDDQLVDVVSDGEIIEPGRPVIVIKARANRVVVREVT